MNDPINWAPPEAPAEQKPSGIRGWSTRRKAVVGGIVGVVALAAIGAGGGDSEPAEREVAAVVQAQPEAEVTTTAPPTTAPPTTAAPITAAPVDLEMLAMTMWMERSGGLVVEYFRWMAEFGVNTEDPLELALYCADRVDEMNARFGGIDAAFESSPDREIARQGGIAVKELRLGLVSCAVLDFDTGVPALDRSIAAQQALTVRFDALGDEVEAKLQG